VFLVFFVYIRARSMFQLMYIDFWVVYLVYLDLD
jgi:hypothetical protein